MIRVCEEIKAQSREKNDGGRNEGHEGDFAGASAVAWSSGLGDKN